MLKLFMLCVFIMNLLKLTFIVLAIFCLYTILKNNNKPMEHFNIKEEINIKEGIDLKNVQAFTFEKNKYTTGSRLNPIPQLNCVGGNACDDSHIINNIQCTNMGTDDYGKIQWKCNASCTGVNNFYMTNTDVTCEGLTSNTDELKLKGSCGLNYHLYSKYIKQSYNMYIWIMIIAVVFIFFFTKKTTKYHNGCYHNEGYHRSTNYEHTYYTSHNSNDMLNGYGTTLTRG